MNEGKYEQVLNLQEEKKKTLTFLFRQQDYID